MDDLLDPYASCDVTEEEPQMSYDNLYSEEEGLFRELLGRYQDCPQENVACWDKKAWERINAVVDLLIGRGHQQYSRLKLEPRTNGNSNDFLTYADMRMSMMAILQRMTHDFELADPNYLLYQHSPKSVPTITNTNSNSQANNQTQTVNQDVNISIEQKIENLERIITEELSEEQIKEISPLLKEFKTQPTRWSTAQALIRGVLGFGRDVAVQIIGAVLAFYLTK